MQYSTQEYQLAGFFASGSISMIHFQDIIMALILGFMGAAGAWIFQRIVNKIKGRKEN